MKVHAWLPLLAVVLAAAPGYTRTAHRSSRKVHVPSRMVHASFYDAPSRSSFASRHREWRGHTFAISYQGRTVHAVCRDYGPVRRDREIDVSRDVARRLGFIRSGTAHVSIRRVR